MSNYTKTTNFATKDNLNSGNPLKIVKGTEIDTEFNNIATAVATKTDNASAAITGGSITGITDLAVADGGTGASTAANARTNLSAAASGANSDITSITGLTTALTVAQGGTGVTSSTGTGNVVLSNSPTLVTPALGTPSALVGTNITGTASGLTAGNVTTNANLTGGVTSVGNATTVVTNANLTGAITSVGNATSLGSFSSANLLAALTDETGTGSAVFATSPTLVTPILGTPTSGTLTNATGLPISTGVSGLGTGVATFLGTPSSANLISAVTDETGTGSLVFATSPTLVTPALGTPSALVGTNITGTASGLTAGNVTTNANLTGAITSTGNATSLGSFSSANLLAALTDETGTGANVFATSPTLVTPILGTPTSATLTNATGLPLTTGVTGQLPVANGGTGTATPSIVAGTNVTVTGTWPNQTIAASGGSGSVTSVAATVPSLFSISGSPITTSGTLAMTYSGTALPVANGGTGQTSYTDGQLLIGNSTGNTLTKATLTAGSGVTITNASGAITIASSGGASAATPTALGTVYGITPSGTAAVALGYQAATTTTSAVAVTAIGYQALTANTATNNTAVGYQAGYSTTSGPNNVAVGFKALFANTTGDSQVAVGYTALTANTTGYQSTALGHETLLAQTTGGGNTAAGFRALKAVVTGTDNSAFGGQALLVNTGNSNTAVGGISLFSNTSGTGNSVLGYGSGSSITTGSKNTIIGSYSGNQSSLDIRTASNHIVLSDGDGNARGYFDGSGNGFFSGCRTAYPGEGNTTNGIFLESAGKFLASRDNTNPACFNRNTSDGTIVDFRTAGTSRGSVSISGSTTSYNTSSDYRLKNTIAPMTGALAKVALLKPVTYKWNADGSNGEGFIAHELAEVVPSAVTGEKDAIDSNGNPVHQGIDVSFLVATLTAAIQELKAELDAYKATHP